MNIFREVRRRRSSSASSETTDQDLPSFLGQKHVTLSSLGATATLRRVFLPRTKHPASKMPTSATSGSIQTLDRMAQQETATVGKKPMHRSNSLGRHANRNKNRPEPVSTAPNQPPTGSTPFSTFFSRPVDKRKPFLSQWTRNSGFVDSSPDGMCTFRDRQPASSRRPRPVSAEVDRNLAYNLYSQKDRFMSTSNSEFFRVEGGQTTLSNTAGQEPTLR